ncbi:MAG: hypothetical protein QOC58_811, partial [Mycobacterium sp.]|nr:hypothetical protein [Mycobacterium sp.]
MFYVLRARGCSSPLGPAGAGFVHTRVSIHKMPVWDWCAKVTTLQGGRVSSTTDSAPARPAGVLAVLTNPELRDEFDRVAAAVGVRPVHAGAPSPVSRKSWLAAAAVVLDEPAARRCGEAALPRRAHVSVLTGGEPVTATWAAAVAAGAERVLRLPDQEHELIVELAEAAEAARDDALS